MSKIFPHLRFNDSKCREALDFYKECFGQAEIFIMTVGESPMAEDSPAETHNKIIHASFKSNGAEFVASDMMMDQAIIGDNVSLMLECESEAEINEIFARLSRDGQIFMPVEKQFWGALFGVVTDKYGIEWNLNFTLK